MVSYKLDTDLVAWYPMTEGSGTTLNDYSSNGYDLTITSPDWEKNSFQGSYGLNLGGDASGSYIRRTSTVVDITNHTICCWIKTADYATDQQRIFETGTNANSIIITATGTAYGSIPAKKLAWFDNSTAQNINVSWNDSWDDEWIFVVATVSNTNIELFVNGVSQVSGTITRTNTNSAGLFLGHDSVAPNDRQLNGTIAYTILFDRILSIEEVKDIYNSTYRA